MAVQLLLLLALAGPFCAFTHASPTMATAEPETLTTDVPHVITEAYVTASVADDYTTTGPPLTPTEVRTQFEDSVKPTDVTETDAPVTSATSVEPEILTTIFPLVEKVSTQLDQISETTEVKTTEEVLFEEDVEEGMSSGQVGGIVIGALVALVIVIAVVIAVVRRMGKYSP